MVKSKSRYIYIPWQKGKKHIRELKNTSKKVISVGTVALDQNSSCRHCGARSEQWCVGVIYRLSIFVSADVSQPIQKIVGIGYLMSADTNNVLGIRGVTPPTRNPNHGKFWFAPSGCPNFPPSASLPPSTLRHRRRLPRRCADPAFGLDATDSAPVVIPDPHHRPQPCLPR
jgi:hypothetical protein